MPGPRQHSEADARSEGSQCRGTWAEPVGLGARAYRELRGGGQSIRVYGEHGFGESYSPLGRGEAFWRGAAEAVCPVRLPELSVAGRAPRVGAAALPHPPPRRPFFSFTS